MMMMMMIMMRPPANSVQQRYTRHLTWLTAITSVFVRVSITNELRLPAAGRRSALSISGPGSAAHIVNIERASTFVMPSPGLATLLRSRPIKRAGKEKRINKPRADLVLHVNAHQKETQLPNELYAIRVALLQSDSEQSGNKGACNRIKVTWTYLQKVGVGERTRPRQ